MAAGTANSHDARVSTLSGILSNPPLMDALSVFCDVEHQEQRKYLQLWLAIKAFKAEVTRIGRNKIAQFILSEVRLARLEGWFLQDVQDCRTIRQNPCTPRHFST